MSIVAKLLLLFTLIPIVEISLLVPLHDLIGGWQTIALVCCTALLGTFLTRWQGTAALNNIKKALAEGKMPGDEIIDGVLVLLAGATLITPGILTDTTGLLLLIPTIRRPVRAYARKRFDAWMAKTAVETVHSSFDPYGYESTSHSPYDQPPRSSSTASSSTRSASLAGETSAETEAQEEFARANIGKPDAIF